VKKQNTFHRLSYEFLQALITEMLPFLALFYPGVTWSIHHPYKWNGENVGEGKPFDYSVPRTRWHNRTFPEHDELI